MEKKLRVHVPPVVPGFDLLPLGEGRCAADLRAFEQHAGKFIRGIARPAQFRCGLRCDCAVQAVGLQDGIEVAEARLRGGGHFGAGVEDDAFVEPPFLRPFHIEGELILRGGAAALPAPENPLRARTALLFKGKKTFRLLRRGDARIRPALCGGVHLPELCARAVAGEAILHAEHGGRFLETVGLDPIIDLRELMAGEHARAGHILQRSDERSVFARSIPGSEPGGRAYAEVLHGERIVGNHAHEPRGLPVCEGAGKFRFLDTEHACDIEPCGFGAGCAGLHQAEQIDLREAFRRFGHIFEQKNVADCGHIEQRVALQKNGHGYLRVGLPPAKGTAAFFAALCCAA